ncbi:MAG TPA: hypothetical protein VK639_11635 [Terriglobales bacterium]|jgi:hypothetical protein|nr:hypothetical protein [Terriglobales bacterium]
MKWLISMIATLLLLAGLASSGCSSSGADCSIASVGVLPASATADHSAAPPGNSQQFVAVGAVPKGCVPIPAVLIDVTWSVSDTTNVTISNTQGQTFGMATCIGTTGGPVTVTATRPAVNGHSLSGTSTLTCK